MFFFDQSSTVQPISESRGGPPSMTQEVGRKFFCLILDGYYSLFVHVALHSVHSVEATTVNSWSGQVFLT